jgi:hypothetical protein
MGKRLRNDGEVYQARAGLSNWQVNRARNAELDSTAQGQAGAASEGGSVSIKRP